MTGDDGRPVTRCWSLSAFGEYIDTYRLTVRRQSGPGSNWLHRAEVGATVELRAPAGKFVLDLGAFRPIVLVAAGIGITPLLAMLHAHLARGEGAAPVFLVYGARTPQEMAFRDELDALADAHPSLHITYAFSQSDAHGQPPSRVTPEMVIEVLGDLHVVLHDTRIPLPWFEHEAYICGPGGFCAEIKGALVARGANADNIAFELFSAPESEASDIEVAEVRFARSGVTCAWSADDDFTLLDLAEQAGLEIASDCRAGSCLTCKTPVLSGETTGDFGDGSALLCVGRPKTAALVLDC
jgi:ferredoxin-NADP reductase